MLVRCCLYIYFPPPWAANATWLQVGPIACCFTLVRPSSSSAAAGEWNGTTTAVKVLEHQEAEGGGQLLEALLSAQISHPNVVRVGIDWAFSRPSTRTRSSRRQGTRSLG